jgi:AcrR family transcriptional regulator
VVARSALTPERIVATAVELADDAGLAQVSMRRLAGRLGVEAMSLYHHVANKEALLDAMVDAVFAEFHAPRRDRPWRHEVHRRCRTARAALLRHRWAIGLLDSRRHPGPVTLQHHDAMLACLYGASDDAAWVGRAYATLDSYVFGFVAQEVALPFEPGGSATFVDEVLGDLTASFPYLARYVAERAGAPTYSFADEFEPGLTLILDALDTARPSAPAGGRSS